MGHAYQVNVNTILSPALMQIKGETMVVLASVSISNGRVEEGSQYNPVKCIKKTNALSKCKLVKFREVSIHCLDLFERCDYREHIKKKNEQIKIIFTIITTSIVTHFTKFSIFQC